MDFWTIILNTLPQSLAIAILTSVFTGLIVFYFQNRIKNSFAEKIEQLKTDLQKELIEHQTKFSATYSKAIEVLDGGYKELSALSDTIENVFSVLSMPDQTLDSNKYTELRNKILKARREYTRYFSDNRRYLSDEIIPDIDAINQKATDLGLAAITLHYYEDYSISSLIYEIERISIVIEKPTTIPKEYSRADETVSKWLLFQELSGAINKEYGLLKEDFNKLYKSVSGG